MKKWLKRASRILAIVIGIFVCAWLIVFGYFKTHKKEILNKTLAAIRKNVSGTVTISDMDLDFPSTFPYISVELKNVLIRDSLYETHHHDLLKAGTVLLQVNPFTALAGNFSISRIVAANGSLYGFENATNYSNLEAFKSPSTTKTPKGKKQVNIHAIRLENMRVTLDKRFKRKFYDFNIRKLVCNIRDKGDVVRYRVKTSMNVLTLSFNLQKGSFAKNQPLAADIELTYHKPSRSLAFDDQVLRIGNEPYYFKGKFNFAGDRSFHLEVHASRAQFAKTAALLPHNIQKNIDSIFFDKPITAMAEINGKLVPGYKAEVKVNWKVKNATIQTPYGMFEKTSFSGFFFNHLSDTLPAVSENSIIQLNDFSAKWVGVGLESKKIAVTNLKKPWLYCDLRSSAELATLNEIVNTETIQFNKGTINADVVYSGPVYDSATDAPNINGTARISDGWLVYGPRQIQLEQFNGDLNFSGSDVYFKKISALAQGNKVEMNIAGKNLLALMNSDPSKATLQAEVYSPDLDISKFSSFIGGRQKRKSNGKLRAGGVSSRIDRLLDQCTILSVVNADKFKFKNFTADHLRTTVLLNEEVWAVKNTSFGHAGGNVFLTGSLHGGSRTYNPINLNATLENIDISRMFNAFNNFKLSSLHSKNLQGKLYSTIDLSGALLEKAELVPSSLKGTINLSLKQGELNHFQPLESMSVSLLKNRDFSHISFSEIKNRFDFNGSLVYINRMEIQSNVLQLFMEGRYDIAGKSTDLQIQVPISNLKKRDTDIIPDKKGVNSKAGISVYINAKSNDRGDIDFSYSLFHKKIKKK